MNDHELRTLTRLNRFYPQRIAKALDAVVEAIPDDGFDDRLVALCIWEHNAPVVLDSVSFYAIWDDSEGSTTCHFADELSGLIRQHCEKKIPAVDVEYLPLSEVLNGFIAHEETVRRRMAKSIVLFDQETVVPLKALLEMKEEWDYQPFRSYLKTSLSGKSDDAAEETQTIHDEIDAAAPGEDVWPVTWERATALKTVAQVMQKFQPYVDVVALFPENSPVTTPNSVLIVINDTDVKRLQRVELKLKIQSHVHEFEANNSTQGLVSVMLLTEFYDVLVRNPEQVSQLVSSAVCVRAKPLWNRLCRLDGKLASSPSGPLDLPRMWSVGNVPLWLGLISPNIELRGYENRKVSGLWGRWQSVVDFANRREIGIVTSFVWLFVISFLVYLGASAGFNAVKVPLFLVAFVFFLPFFQHLVFGALVKAGWARYSPFIMPLVICALWAGAFFGSKLVETVADDNEISIERLESIRSSLTDELNLTSQRLQDTLKQLEAADSAQHEAIQKEIGSLTVHREKLEEDISVLSTVRGDQAETLGRIYVEQMRGELEEQGRAGQQWDVLLTIVALIVGGVVGQALQYVAQRLGLKRKENPPLSV